MDFDNFAPFIEKEERKHLDNIYAYREACDILMYMQPVENFKEEVRVEWSGEEYGDNQWIGVFHLDGNYWEEALARYSISDSALAGFWKLIREFYGYNDIRTGTVIEDNDEQEVTAVLLLNKM